MQTWASLAAKHATITSGIGLGGIPAMGWGSLDGVAVGALLAGVGFAVLNSPRRAQSCPLPPMMSERPGQVQTSRPAGGRLARARQRVDGLLTGMLSDESDRTTPVPATRQNEPAAGAGEHATAAEPGQHRSDEAFWGPAESDNPMPTSYRSRHRVDAPASDTGPAESRRIGPRHAAPPASFGATIGRRLASPRLTSRSAAHAGG